MSITALYRGFGVRVHSQDIDPLQVIGGITQYRVSDDVNVEREATNGDVFPVVTSLLSHQEQIEITSLNVAQVLDVIGTTANCVRGDDSQAGIEFWLTALDQCNPGISTSADNIRYRVVSPDPQVRNLGMIHPGQLTIPHGENATMSFVLAPQGIDGNAGIEVTGSLALPAIADDLTRFGMGTAYIGLTGGDRIEIQGKKNIDIAFNVSLLNESSDGDLFPSWISADNIASTITIRGIDPRWALAANIPRGGKAFAHAQTSIYLRKRSPGAQGGYVADGTAEHIKITAAGKAFVTDLASGSGSAPTQTSIVMYVEKDSSGNVPIIAATNQAITVP